MIPILDKNEESGNGGYIHGMNTIDDPRDLVQGECQLLENTLPGKRMKGRNGIADLFINTGGIGRGAEHTRYTPHSVLMFNPSGEEYLFVWTQQIITTDVFVIEAIKVSDGTRSALMTAKYSSVDTTCGMLKLYSSVYCIFSHSIVENYTNGYLVNNVIIFWDSTISMWGVRSWGINDTPLIGQVGCVDVGGENVLDARVGCSAALVGANVYLSMGTDSVGRKMDILYTANMNLWNSNVITPIEELLDGDGNPFIEPMVVPAEWVGREGHRLIFYDNKLWVIGGESDSGLMNDMWFSSDSGKTWYLYIRECDWSARKFFACVVFGGKIFLLGGQDVSGANDEVWSFDGVSWTEETTTGFAARYAHEAVVYNSKIWVALGEGSTDVISSVDGVTWVEATDDASLGARENFGLIVHDNKMWIIGGYNGSTAYLKSVYYSVDGVTWTVATLTAAWTERAGHVSISFSGKMYVTCGYDGTNYLGDTWYSEDGITWSVVSTGLTKDLYYGYSFTFVRRDDILCKLESMTYYDYKPWETYNGRTLPGIDEKLLTGVVTLSGTALSGTGTLFSSELSTGNRVRVDGIFGYITIVSVTDGTTAVVSNDNGHVCTDAEFSLLPNDGDFITTGEYNPGIDESAEIASTRQIVSCAVTTDYGRGLIPMAVFDEALALGATHLRVRRTLGAESSVIAAGLSYLYLVDIAIANDVYDSENHYIDELSDEIQQTETHTIETNGFEACPFGAFNVWDNERVWISTGSGFWLFSVGASQDVEYPQKYASLFNGNTQRIVCDPEDGLVDTGSIVHEGDLYTFKTAKIQVLDQSNPNNTPRDIADSIGCDFPNTITHVDNTLFGKCVLFLSNQGPAILRSGGVVEILNRMQLKEVWPKEYFFIDQNTGEERTPAWKETVFAEWHQNAWRVFVPGQSIPTVYSYYIDSKDGVSGSFVDTLSADLSAVYLNDPASIVVKNGHIAYSLSNKFNAYRLSWFLKRGSYQDFFGGEYCSIHQKTHSRKRGFDQNQTIMGELSDVVIHCNMTDTSGLSVIAYCDENRYNATMVYSESIDNAIEAGGYNSIRTMIQGILKEGAFGRSFSVLIDKTIPSNGSFVFSGVDMNLIPQEAFKAEFYGSFAEKVKGWV